MSKLEVSREDDKRDRARLNGIISSFRDTLTDTQGRVENLEARRLETNIPPVYSDPGIPLACIEDPIQEASPLPDFRSLAEEMENTSTMEVCVEQGQARQRRNQNRPSRGSRVSLNYGNSTRPGGHRLGEWEVAGPTTTPGIVNSSTLSDGSHDISSAEAYTEDELSGNLQDPHKSLEPRESHDQEVPPPTSFTATTLPLNGRQICLIGDPLGNPENLNESWELEERQDQEALPTVPISLSVVSGESMGDPSGNPQDLLPETFPATTIPCDVHIVSPDAVINTNRVGALSGDSRGRNAILELQEGQDQEMLLSTSFPGTTIPCDGRDMCLGAVVDRDRIGNPFGDLHDLNESLDLREAQNLELPPTELFPTTIIPCDGYNISPSTAIHENHVDGLSDPQGLNESLELQGQGLIPELFPATAIPSDSHDVCPGVAMGIDVEFPATRILGKGRDISPSPAISTDHVGHSSMHLQDPNTYCELQDGQGQGTHSYPATLCKRIANDVFSSEIEVAASSGETVIDHEASVVMDSDMVISAVPEPAHAPPDTIESITHSSSPSINLASTEFGPISISVPMAMDGAVDRTVINGEHVSRLASPKSDTDKEPSPEDNSRILELSASAHENIGVPGGYSPETAKDSSDNPSIGIKPPTRGSDVSSRHGLLSPTTFFLSICGLALAISLFAVIRLGTYLPNKPPAETLLTVYSIGEGYMVRMDIYSGWCGQVQQ